MSETLIASGLTLPVTVTRDMSEHPLQACTMSEIGKWHCLHEQFAGFCSINNNSHPSIHKHATVCLLLTESVTK